MEWGTTEGNMALVSNAYKRISDLYCEISYISMDEIKRESPIYWEQYRNCERELDDKCKDLSTDGYTDITNKMISVWTKIVEKVTRETDELVASGMPLPEKREADYGISFYKEEGKAETVPVGFVTSEEIRLYFDNKLSVKEIQQRNITEYDDVCGRRVSTEMLIGPCGLMNDGTGNVKFNWKEVPRQQPKGPTPSLQASALLAPEPVSPVFKESPSILEDLLDTPVEPEKPKPAVYEDNGVLLLNLD